MKRWYATFGGGHTHPVTGEPLRDAYTLVPGETYEEAHQAMTRSVFGRQWAFLYEHADGGSNAAGVQRFNLHEVPFVPSSPVGVAMWAAYDRATANGHSPHYHGVAQVMAEAAELAWHREAERVRLAWLRACAEADRLRATAAAILTPDAVAGDLVDYEAEIRGTRTDPSGRAVPIGLARSAEEEPAEAASEINERSPLDLVGIRERYYKSERWHGGPHAGWTFASESSRDVPALLAAYEQARGQLDFLRAAVVAIATRCEQSADGLDLDDSALVATWKATAEELRRALAGAP